MKIGGTDEKIVKDVLIVILVFVIVESVKLFSIYISAVTGNVIPIQVFIELTTLALFLCILDGIGFMLRVSSKSKTESKSKFGGILK